MSNTTTLWVSCYSRFDNLAHAPKGTPIDEEGSLVTVQLDESTGVMQLQSTIKAMNPSFIRHHPSKSVIYVATECIDENGDVLSYSCNRETGELTALGAQSAHGSSTCFLSVTPNQKHLLFVNYWDSSLGVMPLDEHGHLQPACAVQPPPTPVVAGGLADHLANRQSEPHAHAIVLEPYFGQVVLVPDLGTDEIRQYIFDAEHGSLTPVGKLPCAPRELAPHGPRYLEFDPIADAAYVVNELSSTVSVFRFDRAAAAQLSETVLNMPHGARELAPRDIPVLHFVGLVSTRVPNPPAHRNTCGRITVDPSGQYVLVSNRGDDTISTFRIERDGASVTGLTPLQIEPTRGATPRHFQFSPTGSWVLAANQDTDSVTSFAFDAETGKLTFSGHCLHIGSPNFVCAMPSEASLRAQAKGIQLRARVPASTSAEF